MTLEQKKRVEDNHNLIYSFLHKNNLSIDEYYDICAIGLCKASINYEETVSCFSTFAYYCMYNEIKTEWRKNSSQKSIPKDKILYYQNNLDYEKENSFENYSLKSDYNLEEECVTNNFFKDILDNLSERDKEIIILHLKGYKQKELSKKFNISQSYISKIIEKFKKEMRYYI